MPVGTLHAQFRKHFFVNLIEKDDTNLLTLVAEPGEMSLSMRLRGVCPSGVALNT